MTAEEYLELIHPNEQEPNPTYYTILEAHVRYSEELSDFEKILYSEIVLLTKAKGVCFATNNYFARVYKKQKETISRAIGNLNRLGFIKTEIIYKPNSKEILGRVIYIPLPQRFTPSDYDDTTGYYTNQYVNTVYTSPIQKKDYTPIQKKDYTPIDKNIKDNNTSLNITRESESTTPPVYKSTYEETKGDYKDFEWQVVVWYSKLTGRPINDIRQIPDFRTPENRSILEKAFADRKCNSEEAIKKAGERAQGSAPNFRWKDFLQALYINLAEAEVSETAFVIPDAYQGCVEYYIQDCDWNTDKFIAACQYLLNKADANKRFTNAQIDELTSAFENRKAHAGYSLMLAYDKALYKRSYFNLNFFDRIITYLRDEGEKVPRSPRGEGIIQYKYNIVFDNYISETPKEVKLGLKWKREAAKGLRCTELATVRKAEPVVGADRSDANETAEEYSNCLAYVEEIKQDFMGSLKKLAGGMRLLD